MTTAPREVLTTEVVIVGSGFGGITAALMLRGMGLEDFAILERRPFLGGTWLQNTYPGAQVDVPSPLYSIEAEPYDWSQLFAPQPELAAYTEHVVDKHGLRSKTQLSTEVLGMAWEEASRTWLVRTSAARDYRARFVITATGPLSQPVIPEFVGLSEFRGPAFHTNRWDHSVDLRGKRVAIIGSGASAAQVIPAIAPEVAELHVFQRTPHWVMPRKDRVFTPRQRALLRRPWAYKLLRSFIYWEHELRVIGFKYAPWILDRVAGGWARDHLAAQIPDPELRARLTPDYTIGCKRILISNTLYPALCRDNVTLHHRDDAVDHFVADGVVTAGGQALGLDVVIFATGFDAVHGLVSCPVAGRQGKLLSDAWAEFPRAYLGTAVPDFPNWFVVTGPNTGIGHTSALFIIEAQMAYIRRCLIEARKAGDTAAIEVTAEAEEAWTTWVHEAMTGTVWEAGGCRSWYQTNTGKVIAMFPGFSFSFRRLTRRFRRRHHRVG